MATFTKSGSGIKVTTGPVTMLFYDPVVNAYPTKAGDNRVNLIEVTEGKSAIVLPITDITAIGAGSPTGDVHSVADQIMALTA